MDFVPREALNVEKKHRFRSMKLVDVDLEEQLCLEPEGADYGKLDNGFTYYVRRNATPKMRAALALAVKVGSVVEEENERGVAHIVEHLAFSATKSYSNHEIVKFLESIGASFGACGNAYTSCDETVYELFVPIVDLQLLSKAISILAEFSSQIRLGADDLEKERGAVLEEYRTGRDADGRLYEQTWACLLKDSKYAERLPIGLEDIIRTVTPEIRLEDIIRTVTPEVAQSFYRKWYNIKHMALVAVGDFVDCEAVIELIKEHFGSITPENPPSIPVIEVPLHQEPRYSCLVEPETSGTTVEISWKMPNNDLKTVKDYKNILIETMFRRALNRRFVRITHNKDPPYFLCSASEDESIKPIKVSKISSCCKEKGILVALESILSEVTRVRLHGFSEREIYIVKAEMMSEMESAYLERDQYKSTSWRDTYIQHFLRDSTVLAIETSARLYKSLLPQITPLDVSEYANKLMVQDNCVIIATEPRATVQVGDLESVVSKITSLEETKTIANWEETQIPEELVVTKPTPGDILQQSDYSEIGVSELILSNGMKVCYKCTNLKNDQVIFKGYAFGGDSELKEKEYLSASTASAIAAEIGIFGHKPTVLSDMLAGKRAEVDINIGPYTRSFYGDCSPSDMETALQLVYQLFVTNVEPDERNISRLNQILEEIVQAEERDPFTAFSKRVTQIKYGNSYFFKPLQMIDLPKIDYKVACEYFNNCFKDPSSFTVVIVGNLEPSIANPLIVEYLGGIPKSSSPVFHFDYDSLTSIPRTFPTKTIRDVVRSPMVEAQCTVHISFNVTLKSETMDDEVYFVSLLSQLLETKLTEVLRFQHGQIYSVSVSSDFDYSKPSRTDDLRGDINITFSCNPEASATLVDIALNEIMRLQEKGPSEEDISAENYQWLLKILMSYLSRFYSGDVDSVFKALNKARTRVRQSLTPLTAKWALQRHLPNPCKSRFVAVTLVPETNPLRLLGNIISHFKPTDLAIYSKHKISFSAIVSTYSLSKCEYSAR
ncbi:hypothetical protein V2J09_011602 [Rumex salicifolius]